MDGIKKGKFAKFARAVNKSHVLLRENYNVSCPEIDWILKRVGELEPNLQDIREPVTCGRVIGKGLGCCLYAFVRDGDVETYKKNLLGYTRIFGLEPLMYEVIWDYTRLPLQSSSYHLRWYNASHPEDHLDY